MPSPPRDSSATQTNWDLIRDAASGSESARGSLDAVTKRAWPAVYAYIRASGRQSEEAAELTQGFMADVFLSRQLLGKADQSRGRFRTLLINSVRNYLADMHRRQTAGLRKPTGGITPLDQMRERGDEPVDTSEASPERAFNARYVAVLIRAASERLHAELASAGDLASWEIFQARVLRAAFDGNAPSYDEIGPRVGLDKGTCAARLLVAKRRFATILMEELRATIDNPADLQAEITELRALLSNG